MFCHAHTAMYPWPCLTLHCTRSYATLTLNTAQANGTSSMLVCSPGKQHFSHACTQPRHTTLESYLCAVQTCCAHMYLLRGEAHQEWLVFPRAYIHAGRHSRAHLPASRASQPGGLGGSRARSLPSPRGGRGFDPSTSGPRTPDCKPNTQQNTPAAGERAVEHARGNNSTR